MAEMRGDGRYSTADDFKDQTASFFFRFRF